MTTVVVDAQQEMANILAEQAQTAPTQSPAPEKTVKVTASSTEPAKVEVVEQVDSEDVEDENGLSARQKRELTDKMLKAVGKKHREMKEAEEFAADQYNQRRLAEQKLEQLERELNRAKAAEPAIKAEPDKPKRENFETDDAYRDALDDWRVDQKFRAREVEENQRREQQRMEEVREMARTRISKAMELVPDFQEVTEAADLQVPPVIAGYMQESEMFAELGYHFAKHPDALERLQKMRPDKALVEIGKIESTLTPFVAKTKTNGAPPSTVDDKPVQAESSSDTGEPLSQPRKTAPVIRPLSSASVGQVQKEETEMNTREVIQDWQRKRKANLGLRKRH